MPLHGLRQAGGGHSARSGYVAGRARAGGAERTPGDGGACALVAIRRGGTAPGQELGGANSEFGVGRQSVHAIHPWLCRALILTIRSGACAIRDGLAGVGDDRQRGSGLGGGDEEEEKEEEMKAEEVQASSEVLTREAVEGMIAEAIEATKKEFSSQIEF